MILPRRREQPNGASTAIHDALEAALLARTHCSLLVTRSEYRLRFGSEEQQPDSPDAQSDATFTGLVDTRKAGARRIFCRFKFDDGLDGPPTDPWVGHCAFTFERHSQQRTHNRLVLDGVLHDRSGTRSRLLHEAVRDTSVTSSEPLRMRLAFDPVEPEAILNGLRSSGYSGMIVIRRVTLWPTVAVRGLADWAWKHDEP